MEKKELKKLTRKELEAEFLKMPKLEKEEPILKAMRNLNTFHCSDGEIYLSGKDEHGKDFTICYDAYEFLNWINSDEIEYIKERLIKHIKEK